MGFKVGDEVEVIFSNHNGHEVGAKGVITQYDGSVIPYGVTNEEGTVFWHTNDELKLIKSKVTKKQRIETLEKEVSELKLIVHELRERKVVEPSTVDDVLQKEIVEVIEFEGAKYRKVERKAREGDVVIFENVERLKCGTNDNKPYKVVRNNHYKDEDGELMWVYGWNSSCPTPKVYEPITEPSTTTTVEDEPKSKNQLRAEVIEKAKGFVEENGEGWEFSTVPKIGRTIAYNLHELLSKIGESKCNPSDVFNEHIGKAIALGRALGLDVSEFEQAVQPTLAIGQIVERYHPHSKNYLGKLTVKEIREVSVYGKSISATNTHILNDGPNYGEAHGDKIINDTNVIYGGAE